MTRIGYIDHKTGTYHAAGERRPQQSVAPQLIRDGLDYVLNPADGRRYTSKRAYYAAVRAAGAEIVGNEAQDRRETPGDPIAPDIKRAIEELGSR